MVKEKAMNVVYLVVAVEVVAASKKKSFPVSKKDISITTQVDLKAQFSNNLMPNTVPRELA